jgi:hypothetical protein
MGNAQSTGTISQQLEKEPDVSNLQFKEITGGRDWKFGFLSPPEMEKPTTNENDQPQPSMLNVRDSLPKHSIVRGLHSS